MDREVKNIIKILAAVVAVVGAVVAAVLLIVKYKEEIRMVIAKGWGKWRDILMATNFQL